jgi:hypothetical protein
MSVPGAPAAGLLAVVMPVQADDRDNDAQLPEVRTRPRPKLVAVPGLEIVQDRVNHCCPLSCARLAARITLFRSARRIGRVPLILGPSTISRIGRSQSEH